MQLEDNDEKFQQIRAEREHGRNYLSTINARFNPDLLIGDSLGSMSKTTQFIKGDQYFSKRGKDGKQKNSSSEDDKNESEEEPGQSQSIKAIEDDGQDSQDDETQFDKMMKRK